MRRDLKLNVVIRLKKGTKFYRGYFFVEQEGGGPSVPCRGSLHYQRRPGGKCEALVQLINTVTSKLCFLQPSIKPPWVS